MTGSASTATTVAEGSRRQQPHRERARAAAEVEDERVGPPGARLHRVDERGEPVLAVGHVDLLLKVPALDPVPGGGGVEGRQILQFWHDKLPVTG